MQQVGFLKGELRDAKGELTERERWELRQAEQVFKMKAGVSGAILFVAFLMAFFSKDENSKRWAFAMIGTIAGAWVA